LTTFSLEPATVVVVLYPFSDLALSRPRPAVVLSAPEFNIAVGQVLLAMVTTAARSSWPEDTPLRDLKAAGLKQPSVVRMRFTTVVASRIRLRLGVLAPTDRAAVAAALARVLKL